MLTITGVKGQSFDDSISMACAYIALLLNDSTILLRSRYLEFPYFVLQHCNWRKLYNVDTILQEYVIPEVLKKYYCDRVFGVDKCGFPFLIERMGPVDMRGLSCFELLMVRGLDRAVVRH